MDWLAENWFWVLIGVVFIGMHMFGHGGHSGHGGHGMHGGGHGKQDDYEDKDQQRKSRTPDSGHGHH